MGYRPWYHKELDTTERLSTCIQTLLIIGAVLTMFVSIHCHSIPITVYFFIIYPWFLQVSGVFAQSSFMESAQTTNGENELTCTEKRCVGHVLGQQSRWLLAPCSFYVAK